MSKPITELKNRLSLALALKEMTPAELSEKTGISRSSISQYMSGYAKPKNDRIYLIANALNISEAWLLGYDVPMDREKEPAELFEKKLFKKYKDILYGFNSLDPQGQETVRYILDNEKKRCEKISELSSRVKELETEISEKLIPKKTWAYYGKNAAAGKSFGFDDITAGTIEMPLTDENKNADYTIGVSGDSMEPTFYDGDIVYVKKATELNIGDIGIFQKDSGIYIKEVGNGELLSHNAKYSPMKSDMGFLCLGKVIGKAE